MRNLFLVGKLFTFSPDSTLKKLISPLCDPVATRSPSGLNLAFQDSTGAAVIDLISRPLFSKSQIRILESIEVETRPNHKMLDLDLTF